MPTPLKTDLCVIGAGRAGSAVALAAAAAGTRTVLVDDGLSRAASEAQDLVSGLLQVAGAIAGRRASAALSDDGLDVRPDFGRILALARRHARALSDAYAPHRLVAAGVHVLRSDALFTGPKTLTAGENQIAARRFVIATGAATKMPSLPELAALPALTVPKLDTLTRLPARLIVMGDGAGAMELAQAFALAGTAVTLVSEGPLLPGCDPEIVGFAQRRLRLDGVTVHTGATVTAAVQKPRGMRLDVEVGAQKVTLDATQLLLTQTETRLGALDLGKTGGAGRRIIVLPGDDPQREELVATLLTRAPLAWSPKGLLEPVRIVRTSPQLAWIGPTERDAMAARGACIVRLPLTAVPAGRLGQDGPGLLKIVIDRGGQVLSAAIAGHMAGELIAPWALAVGRGMTLDDLAAHPAPTATHAALMDAARQAFQGSRPAPSLVRRLLKR